MLLLSVIVIGHNRLKRRQQAPLQVAILKGGRYDQLGMIAMYV